MRVHKKGGDMRKNELEQLRRELYIISELERKLIKIKLELVMRLWWLLFIFLIITVISYFLGGFK